LQGKKERPSPTFHFSNFTGEQLLLQEALDKMGISVFSMLKNQALVWVSVDWFTRSCLTR
jgi:hypothetical protein